jgi:hypothetical protein
MQIKTRNRADLKQYFVKNAIPTQKQFAELIEGMLNHKEDGIAKLPNDPLSIEAAGDDTSQKKALHFYNDFGDSEPRWVFSLNPRQDPANAATANRGFAIGDGSGNTRLFIDDATGRMGLGTIRPEARLQIDAGETNVVALMLDSSGPGWGSGFWLKNTNPGQPPKTFGIYAGFGALHITDVDDGGDRILITESGNVAIGRGVQPRGRLDVPEGDVWVSRVLNISATSDGTNAALLNLHNETNQKLWHITMRSGEDDKLIFWRNDTSSFLPVLKLTMDGTVEAPQGASLGAIGVGASIHGPVTWPYETIQLNPDHNLRIWFGTTERFVLDPAGNFLAQGWIGGGETATGWVLGQGAFGPDNWLRLTTTVHGNAYHDLAVEALYAAGIKRFDLAEVTLVREEDGLEQGDAVVIDREVGVRVRRSTQACDPAVYGIVSSYAQAAMVIGGFGGPEQVVHAKDKLPVALVGRVKTKVCGEGGSIRVGDLLTTSSVPGHLMRCEDPGNHPGAIAGKALEAFAGEAGFITTLVSLQ